MMRPSGSGKRVVVKEFTDFLGAQPPFDSLDPDDLARLVARVKVESFAAGDLAVSGDDDTDDLWVVRTGALEVLDRGRVIDLLGPGDTFGNLVLPSHPPPRFDVRAQEDSVCLRIPDPRTFLAGPERLRLAASETVPRPTRLAIAEGTAARRLTDLMRPVVWCEAAHRVDEAARRIGEAAGSCVIVRTDAGPGIVTDHDFRNRVGTGEIGVDAPVADLATVPVLTIDEDATQAAALLQMVEHAVHHLVVTDQAGRPVGVVRAVDLAQAEVRDPLLIRSAIESAADVDELADASRLLPATIADLCDNGVAASHIGAVHAAVVEAIVRRVLVLHREPVLDEVRHSWVLLGSLARREPLPLSDVDTALVWTDAAEPDRAVAIRKAARAVLRDVQRCGLTLCANGANAHNPMFSRSRSGWVAAARSWQKDPSQEKALLLSAMVADSRPLTEVSLGRSLTESMRAHTRTTQFLRALLDEALAWRPPTGFVRDFVVQHSGEHRGQLDLKSGGLMPVVALARWIAIVTGDPRGTTPERLNRGVAARLLSVDEAQTLAGGFEDVYSLLLRREAGAIRSGTPHTTYIVPKELDTLTRRHLRETFRAIGLIQGRVDRDWIWRLGE
jgi:CBS domain-containing protein